MSKQKIVEKIDDESPQKSLEKVLQTEIQITEMISTAKEKADKRVEQAQNKITSFKEDIIEKARVEREEMLKTGIANAKADSEKKIVQAQADSDAFRKSEFSFISEAEAQVEAIILGVVKSEDE